jgi:hypothetical protein
MLTPVRRTGGTGTGYRFVRAGGSATGPAATLRPSGGPFMTEPYGSGQYDQPGQGYSGGQGYGGQPQHGPPYGAPPYGGPAGQPGPGGYPPAGYPGGYPSGSTPLPTPSAPRTAADRLALVATVVTIVGYVCAGAGLLAFILRLTSGDGAVRFAAALEALISGIGLGGLNIAVGAWLTARKT